MLFSVRALALPFSINREFNPEILSIIFAPSCWSKMYWNIMYFYFFKISIYTRMYVSPSIMVETLIYPTTSNTKKITHQLQLKHNISFKTLVPCTFKYFFVCTLYCACLTEQTHTLTNAFRCSYNDTKQNTWNPTEYSIKCLISLPLVRRLTLLTPKVCMSMYKWNVWRSFSL